MMQQYTAKYIKVSTGYMGQLVEWPEVVTEGSDLEECRLMLRDAAQEMVLAYQQQDREIPLDDSLIDAVFEITDFAYLTIYPDIRVA